MWFFLGFIPSTIRNAAAVTVVDNWKKLKYFRGGWKQWCIKRSRHVVRTSLLLWSRSEHDITSNYCELSTGGELQKVSTASFSEHFYLRPELNNQASNVTANVCLLSVCLLSFSTVSARLRRNVFKFVLPQKIHNFPKRLNGDIAWRPYKRDSTNTNIAFSLGATINHNFCECWPFSVRHGANKDR